MARPDRGRPAESTLVRFWPTLAPAFASEIGAIAALLVAALPGIGAGAVALVLLELILPRVRPPEGVVRAAILVAGPPLRYLLLLVATWKCWFPGGEGIVPALLLALVLGFLIPLAGFLAAQARARG
jgi:hypothetical protein